MKWLMKPVARIGKPDVPRQRRTILDRFWWIDWSCWWIAALHDLLLTFAGTDRSNDPWVPCIANLFHPIYYSIGNFVLEISSSKQYDNNERFEAFSARYLRISRIERCSKDQTFSKITRLNFFFKTLWLPRWSLDRSASTSYNCKNWTKINS